VHFQNVASTTEPEISRFFKCGCVGSLQKLFMVYPLI
jgi:hypothetical protein